VPLKHRDELPVRRARKNLLVKHPGLVTADNGRLRLRYWYSGSSLAGVCASHRHLRRVCRCKRFWCVSSTQQLVEAEALERYSIYPRWPSTFPPGSPSKERRRASGRRGGPVDATALSVPGSGRPGSSGRPRISSTHQGRRRGRRAVISACRATAAVSSTGDGTRSTIDGESAAKLARCHGRATP